MKFRNVNLKGIQSTKMCFINLAKAPSPLPPNTHTRSSWRPSTRAQPSQTSNGCFTDRRRRSPGCRRRSPGCPDSPSLFLPLYLFNPQNTAVHPLDHRQRPPEVADAPVRSCRSTNPDADTARAVAFKDSKQQQPLCLRNCWPTTPLGRRPSGRVDLAPNQARTCTTVGCANQLRRPIDSFGQQPIQARILPDQPLQVCRIG